MQSRVAAAMRARIRRLRASPSGSAAGARRAPIIATLVLGGAAAVLFATEALDVGLFSRPAASRSQSQSYRGVVATGFTLCGKHNQRNCVVDGDTIHLDGVKIRLAGIDAPETHEPKCEQERALGRRATERLLQLVNAGSFDIVHRGGRDTDKYGRKLRTLERHGRSLGDTLIAEGLARRWDGAKRSWCN